MAVLPVRSWPHAIEPIVAGGHDVAMRYVPAAVPNPSTTTLIRKKCPHTMEMVKMRMGDSTMMNYKKL